MSNLTRRILAAVAVVFGAITLVFLVLYWLPGDPAAMIAGDDASDATIEHIRQRLGTDKPLWEQYTTYIGHLAHGNIGTSVSTGEPVISRLMTQVPATLELVLLSSVVALVVGATLGVIAGVYRGRWPDHAIQTVLLFVNSMPQFWLGILLILVFSVGLRWLPAFGSGSFQQLILPVAALGLHTSCRVARMVRNSVIDVLNQPFVTTLRGKGLHERQVLFRHVLRNALIPAITMLGVLIGELFSAGVVIETLFARQGLGRLLVEALGAKDIPLVMGVTLLVSTLYVFMNLLVDISYSWIDPRIKS